MKLLITGATGMIGRNIMALAKEKNMTVHFLTTKKHKRMDTDKRRGFYWNPKTGEIDEECFEGVDALIHLAGASISKPWTSTNRKEILDSRILSTRLLRKEMERQKIKLKNIICASAIGIYPDSLVEVFDEKSQLVQENFLQKVTAAWERESHTLAAFGDRLSILRIGLVLAKGEGLLSQLTLPVKLLVGAAFASGKQWQSWIHIRDLSRVFITAIEMDWNGTFNAVAPHPVSQRTLINTLGAALGRPVFLPNIPGFLMKLFMGERAILILGSQKISSQKLLSNGFSFEYDTLNTALEHIFKKKNDILT